MSIDTAEMFTSADLAALPDDNKRYEIIAGELFVSKQPSAEHQYVCGRFVEFLNVWNARVGDLGLALIAPGLLFSDTDDVAPDVIWMSHARYARSVDKAGHIHTAPELVVEVLSPGKANARRDREVKLKLYSQRGVGEYWLADWMQRQVEVYRRSEAKLSLVETLYGDDALTSPLLPDFICQVDTLFFKPPKNG